jgi:hypothetical protein
MEKSFKKIFLLDTAYGGVTDSAIGRSSVDFWRKREIKLLRAKLMD